MNLNTVLIGSEDPKRLTDYYTKLFGKPSTEDGSYAGWQIGNASITVGPHDEVKGKTLLSILPGQCWGHHREHLRQIREFARRLA
jgi:hypothetical protein